MTWYQSSLWLLSVVQTHHWNVMEKKPCILIIGLSWLLVLNHSNIWKAIHLALISLDEETVTPSLITSLWATAVLRNQTIKCQIRKYSTTQHARDQLLLVTDYTLATALSVQSPAKTNVIAKPKRLRKQDDWTYCEHLQNIIWQYRWIKLLCQGEHCYATFPPSF